MKEKAKKTAKAVETIEKELKETKNPVKTPGISTRGRTFQGRVTRKFPKRVSIEFERTIKIPKYERFLKKKTRIHARLPDTMADQIHVGDFIKVQECRPLSKIIHFIIIEKLKSVYPENSNEKEEEGK
ncbi:MAG: 30S ribosomal protein S17 [Nanoarchaeota archaeon]|nr:30S ribosomal protein S17 [Nanoarchaeota archaeon]MBU1051626.1 30S ribosomal protein S17 [Nanoarchaeota archaeon]MBU1988828.1 30S ribosomal protein S17 [Nanoarchaeota archaeon]